MLSEWEKLLIKPDSTILQAIEAINSNSVQIALVADEEKHLLGTVTDGDVRRGLLNGVSLERSVREVMNLHPTIATINEEREDILKLMRSKSIHHIPVVDDQNRIVKVELIDDFILPVPKNNLVVLMAGGTGSRLHPLTKDCPKPLLKVGHKPILETIIENFIEYGFWRFCLSVNYKAEMVRDYFQDGSKWGVEIRYIQEDKRMGTAGALGMLLEKPQEPLFVMNGDLLTKVNFKQLLEFHKGQKAAATMCVRDYHFQIPYGVAKLDRHRLVGIEEKPVQQFFVSAGVYVIQPEMLDVIPKDAPLDMPDFFRKLIDLGHETVVFPIREYWLDIGRMDDFERANGEYYEYFSESVATKERR